MVLSLRPPLTNNYISPGIVRRLGEDLQEERLSDVVGAGAGDQVAARLQELQCPQVDLLVSAVRGRRYCRGSSQMPADRG